MTTAPVADQHRLLEVQALDTRAQQLEHARRTHPLRAKIAEIEDRLGEAEMAVASARTAVGDTRRELTKAEADVASAEAKSAANHGAFAAQAACASCTAVDDAALCAALFFVRSVFAQYALARPCDRQQRCGVIGPGPGSGANGERDCLCSRSVQSRFAAIHASTFSRSSASGTTPWSMTWAWNSRMSNRAPSARSACSRRAK